MCHLWTRETGRELILVLGFHVNLTLYRLFPILSCRLSRATERADGTVESAARGIEMENAMLITR